MLLDKHNRCCNGLWFVNDFCGIICAILTWILIIYAQYSVITCLILPQNDIFYKTINLVIFEVLLFLASVSHLKTMFSDPGSVPRGTATREAIESLGLDDSKILFKCQKCCAIKPERSHHCSICKRCIRKMDHHCPFVNNCVALNNQKYFVLFTFYIALVSIHTLIITVLHLINCLKNDWSNCDSQPILSLFTNDYFKINSNNQASPYAIISIIILIFESLLFAIFTIIMFAVQIQGIYYDETGIENLQKQKLRRCSKNMPFLKRFKIVFGNFSLSWFNPFTKPMFSNDSDLNNLTHYV